MNFEDKNIIITGGSGGIGRVVARSFLEKGGRVAVISVNQEELESVREELSSVSKLVEFLKADVSKRDDILKLEEFIASKFDGKIDVLVNAAGIYGPMGRLEKIDSEFWIKTFEVNIFGTVFMCRLVIPFMKQRKSGRIINFSGGGDGAFPYFTAYSSSKGAVVRFTESLAAELKDFGIFVNAVAPGAVNTGLLEEVLKAGPEKVGQEFYQKSLEQKKEGGVPPQKVANLILFLASKQGSGLSGKIFSAVWDKWEKLPEHLREIASSDVYNMRRIKPKDRGHEWR